MKWLTSLSLLVTIALASPLEKRDDPQGIDISDQQPDVDWFEASNNGVSFAYIKATEGDDIISPTFSSQSGSASEDFTIKNGAYHIARPDESSGRTQANFFVANGGRWEQNNVTLPGALDLDADPSGPRCYGLKSRAMVTWIRDFSDTYNSNTGRPPVILTTKNWWVDCTNNNPSFGSTNPLWLRHHASSPGPLPAGWSFQTIWQYAVDGPNPGNQDLFNGEESTLERFAIGD